MGQHTTAQFWEYDTWAVKRWNVDPEALPSESFYAILTNNPIFWIDFQGDKPIPITSKEFRAFAAKLKITGNKRVGEYFERLSIASVITTHPHVIPNSSLNISSPARQRQNPNNPTSVRPDGIALLPGFNKEGMMFSHAFYEAKATNATITKRYRQGQIYGMIDAAAETAKGKDQRAALTLLLTSDAKLSEEIAVYAATRNVYLYSSVAALDDETGAFILSDPECVSCKYTSAGFSEHLRQLFNFDNYNVFGPVYPGNHTYGLPKSPIPDPDPAEIDIIGHKQQ